MMLYKNPPKRIIGGEESDDYKEIAYMLDPNIQKKNEFIPIKKAIKLIKLANKIFGYS